MTLLVKVGEGGPTTRIVPRFTVKVSPVCDEAPRRCRIIVGCGVKDNITTAAVGLFYRAEHAPSSLQGVPKLGRR
jgi:hypothetical protein